MVRYNTAMKSEAEKTWQLVAEHRRQLASLLTSLSPEQWNHPTLCEGWQVRHVVAHIILESHYALLKDLPLFVRSGFSFNRFLYLAALKLGSSDPQRLVSLLEQDIDRRITPPFGKPIWVLADLLIHIQDNTIPLGRETEIKPAVMEQVFSAWRPGTFKLGLWIVGVTHRLRGLKLIATDIDWNQGSGLIVTGRAQDLMLAIAGREIILSRLSGAGATILNQRISSAKHTQKPHNQL